MRKRAGAREQQIDKAIKEDVNPTVENTGGWTVTEGHESNVEKRAHELPEANEKKNEAKEKIGTRTYDHHR